MLPTTHSQFILSNIWLFWQCHSCTFAMADLQDKGLPAKQFCILILTIGGLSVCSWGQRVHTMPESEVGSPAVRIHWGSLAPHINGHCRMIFAGNYGELAMITLPLPVRARFVILGIVSFDKNPCLKVRFSPSPLFSGSLTILSLVWAYGLRRCSSSRKTPWIQQRLPHLRWQRTSSVQVLLLSQ